MSGAASRGHRLGWLAAEFVVVVLGVVVGLAVDAWREDRADVALEIGYLERLKDNLEVDTTRFEAASGMDARRATLLSGFLAVVDETTPFPADHLDLLDGLTASLMASFETPRRDTYDELLNQADLGRLGSQEVRRGLADYHAWVVRDLAAQFPEWQAAAGRVEFLFIERLPPVIYQWIQAASNPYVISDRSAPSVTVSPAQVRALVEVVRRDGEMRNLLYRQSMIQERLSDTHGNWKVAAVELLHTLDAEMARLVR